MSTCMLSLVGSLLENQNSSSTPHLPKRIVIHDKPDEIVRIGRESSKSKVNYVLEDSSKPRVVSRLHATLRYNGEKGSFSLTDQSVNGTYVNNVRVPLGGVKLETEDIVCFFHRNGANIKPGDKVEPFNTHLKYRVEIVNKAVDENDKEEEIHDFMTSEKANAAEDGGAVMLVNTSTSGSCSSSEESCLADQLCALHIRDPEGAGAESPEQHEERCAGRFMVVECLRAEYAARAAAGFPETMAVELELRFFHPGWCNSYLVAMGEGQQPGSGGDGGSADNKDCAGVGGPGGNDGGNSKEVMCVQCYESLLPGELCGFGECFFRRPHVFCLECVENTVLQAAKDCKRRGCLTKVSCFIDNVDTTDIVLHNKRSTVNEFLWVLAAFRHVEDGLQKAISENEDPDEREELEAMKAEMRAQKKLPGEVCLGCFRAPGTSYYGYQHCCAVHPFCFRCVLGHWKPGQRLPKCPVPDRFGLSHLVVVHGNAAYTVSEAVMAGVREHHDSEEMMRGLLDPLNVVANSSQRVDLTLRERHLPYER